MADAEFVVNKIRVLDMPAPSDLAIFRDEETGLVRDDKVEAELRNKAIQIRFVLSIDTVAPGTVKDYVVEVVDGNGKRISLFDASQPAFGVTVQPQSGPGLVTGSGILKPFIDGAATFEATLVGSAVTVFELVDSEGVAPILTTSTLTVTHI